jgi:hypothetical protein
MVIARVYANQMGVQAMTVLASNDDYLVEYECGLLTIARRTDGHCKSISQRDVRGISGLFKERVRRDGVDKAIASFLRVSTALQYDWSPLYKPHRMP